jgi:hypothetical protein
MFSFCKRKKPEITFWSTIPGIEKITPILPSNKFIPDWYKKLKAFPDEQGLNFKGTVKVCPSFKDYFNSGYVITLWCDLILNVKPDKWEWKTPNSLFTFSHFSKNQYFDYLPKQEKDKIKLVLKADCPWRCKTSKGYKLLQLPLYYDFNEIFEVMPGFISTDVYHELNQQIVIKKYGEFFIPRGTPLCMYIPIKEEEFNFTCTSNEDPLIKNYVSRIGLEGDGKRDMIRSLFKGSYNEIRKKSKCPFK